MKEISIKSNENLIQLSDEQIKNAYDEYFGYYVDALYFWGKGYFRKKWKRKVSYEENVEIFLAVFKGLIDKGLILAITPDCFYDEKTKFYSTKIKKIDGERDVFWDVSSDEIIKYTHSVLPKDLNDISESPDANKKNYVDFWYYDCPQIRWVDKETGQIY